jgi:acetyl-CoA carboxylase biotin carboxyl carrier protein
MTDDTRGPDKDLIQSLLAESRDLIKRLEGSTVQRLSVQAGDYKIEIERGQLTVAAPAASGAVAAAAPGAAPAAAEAVEADTRHAIRAPLVGTFYRSAQPGAKPFVEEGDVVDQGQPLCIVEAMKIMNQVTADRPGKVAEICCKDGDWVEFQQVIIYLDPIGA